jgi:xanthine dehydrogenase small subunit
MNYVPFYPGSDVFSTRQRMRDDVVFYLNGTRHQVAGDRAFAPLVEYLRDEHRLTGTKIGCAEGDCGACTVLLGTPGTDVFTYRPAPSCLLTLLQVDGRHVVTIEGLSVDGGLGPIQQSFVTHHASQCGYCTPGFVVALTALFESGGAADRAHLGTNLAGNLCRCTGYLPILEAALAIAPASVPRLNDIYRSGEMQAELAAKARVPVRIEARDGRVFFRPNSLDEAVAFKGRHPGALVLAGGTELGVERNSQATWPTNLLSLQGIDELGGIRLEENQLTVGANVTWADLEAAARQGLPLILEMTQRFGSPQIKSLATLAGNIAHGSPVADSLCLLLVADAELELTGTRGTRTMSVEAFCREPRRARLAPDELISRVQIGLPAEDEVVRLYKVSKRKEMDVSTFRAAIRIAGRAGTIERAAIAYAGVGPAARRLPATEDFLAGRPFSEATFVAAGRRARAEVEPASDLRGSRAYKLMLAENILLKFYFDSMRTHRQEIGVD